MIYLPIVLISISPKTERGIGGGRRCEDREETEQGGLILFIAGRDAFRKGDDEESAVRGAISLAVA